MLLVVACHVGLPLVGGGFVGVDVFFVLSGFLSPRSPEAPLSVSPAPR